MARTVTRKISLSGATRAAVAKADGRLVIARLVGIATGTKTNIHPQYGESVGLVGAFRALYPDGSEIDAPVVWGPDVLIEPVAAALKGGQPSVSVGPVDIVAVSSESAPIGFTYVLELHGSDDADPLTAMLAAVPNMPALPAPTATKTTKTTKG